LKTKGNTPKYGLIFHSSFIGKAGAKNKGRISRYLANKCSIASRIDCFSETPTSIYGEKLKQQVEDRLKFYETGDLPKKNLDVMQEAMAEVQKEADEFKTHEKKKKKKNKRKAEEMEDEDAEEAPEEKEPSKKKKKEAEEDEAEETPVSEKKKKKKRKSDGGAEVETPKKAADTTMEEDGSSSKKKKKKKKAADE
jgi:nucleolar protein 56